MSLSYAQHARFTRLRWIAFLLIVGGYVLSFFHRMAPASIAGELQREFAASGAELGLLAASYFYVYTVMQIPTGVLVDTLGVRIVASAGGLVAGIGSVLFAAADSLAVAGAGRVLVGLGVSVMFVSMLKINAEWFHDRHFGTFTGFGVLLGNLGAVLSAAPLVWVLDYATWREVFVGLGVLSALLGCLTALGVRNRPEDAHLPSLRELDGQAPHPARTAHWYHGLAEVLRNRATWLGFWPSLGVGGTLFAFTGLWAVPYLQHVHGMSRALAAQHTTMLLGGFAVSALLTGTISDRLGRRKPAMVATFALYFLCWLPLLSGWPLQPPASLVLFALMGVGTSGFVLTWAVAKEVNRPALAGMATGVVNTGAFLGGAILQPLAGWLMDRGWDGTLADGARVYSAADYQVGLGVMAAFALLGLIGAVYVRETYGRYTATHHEA